MRDSPPRSGVSLVMSKRVDDLVRGWCEGKAVAWRPLADLLRQHLAISNARHGVWMEPEVFARHVLFHATRAPGASILLLSRVSALHSADLYLALGAADRIPPALARLLEEHLEPVCETVADLGGPERLRSYGGRSSLRDWIRVIAARDVRDRRNVTFPSYTGPSRATGRSGCPAPPSSRGAAS